MIATNPTARPPARPPAGPSCAARRGAPHEIAAHSTSSKNDFACSGCVRNRRERALATHASRSPRDCATRSENGRRNEHAHKRQRSECDKSWAELPRARTSAHTHTHLHGYSEYSHRATSVRLRQIVAALPRARCCSRVLSVCRSAGHSQLLANRSAPAATTARYGRCAQRRRHARTHARTQPVSVPLRAAPLPM